MKYLTVSNLKRFQHYTKRRPPWIKLHAEFLDNYQFLALSDASKAHLMLLWVVASLLDNRIPYDLKFLSTKLRTSRPLRHSDVEALVQGGFIQVVDEGNADDTPTSCYPCFSEPLSNRNQVAIPETEKEREKEKETKSEIEEEEETTEKTEQANASINVSGYQFLKPDSSNSDLESVPRTKQSLQASDTRTEIERRFDELFGGV